MYVLDEICSAIWWKHNIRSRGCVFLLPLNQKKPRQSAAMSQTSIAELESGRSPDWANLPRLFKAYLYKDYFLWVLCINHSFSCWVEMILRANFPKLVRVAQAAGVLMNQMQVWRGSAGTFCAIFCLNMSFWNLKVSCPSRWVLSWWLILHDLKITLLIMVVQWSRALLIS